MKTIDRGLKSCLGWLSAIKSYRRAVFTFGRQPTKLPTEEEMSKRISIKKLKRAIAAGRSISVKADQVIWSYYKANEGWFRVRTELSSPEAADRLLSEYADEGYLALDPKAGGDATAALKWFDEVLHAQVSNLKMGFILCADGNLEPAIAVCSHVLQGGSPGFYKVPVPSEGEYGQAYCADCIAKKRKSDVGIICYRYYLPCQNGGLFAMGGIN